MKQCEYEQQLQYLKRPLEDVDKMLRQKHKNGSLIEYAYIVHDKDDAEPHLHVMLLFNSDQTAENIAKWFNDEPQYINKKQSRWENKLSYLCHRTKGSENKYQYDFNEVVASFDYPRRMEQIKQDVDKAYNRRKSADLLNDYIQRIASGEIREYNLTDNVDALTFSKYKPQIVNALEYYRRNRMTDKNREIKVVAMTGPTGTGKTTYAKQLCSAMGKSYCVSSSSNDPFQDYKGEDVMILDDLRDSAFKYADLLKILDNHTNSTVQSRYSNKAFIGDMIIITSAEPIENWYTGKTEEDRKQLKRRVTEQMYFDRKFVTDTVYNVLSDKYDFVGKVPNIVTATYKDTTTALFNMLESVNAVIDPAYKQRIIEKAEEEDKKGVLPSQQLGFFQGNTMIPDDSLDDADDMDLPF